MGETILYIMKIHICNIKYSLAFLSLISSIGMSHDLLGIFTFLDTWLSYDLFYNGMQLTVIFLTDKKPQKIFQ